MKRGLTRHSQAPLPCIWETGAQVPALLLIHCVTLSRAASAHGHGMGRPCLGQRDDGGDEDRDGRDQLWPWELELCNGASLLASPVSANASPGGRVGGRDCRHLPHQLLAPFCLLSQRSREDEGIKGHKSAETKLIGDRQLPEAALKI